MKQHIKLGLTITLALLLYGVGGGWTYRLVRHQAPDKDPAGAAMIGMFWPIGLPVVLGIEAATHPHGER